MPIPILSHVPAALRFLSRLPVPRFSFEKQTDGAPDIERLGPALPIAGALLGLIGSLVLLAALGVGLKGFLAATLAFGTLAAISGAFHEDGLADTADALGGMSRERRLEIMRDSRLGSFGAVALILAFVLRIGTLDALSSISAMGAAGALIAASALSRVAGLWILYALPPARADGLAHSAGRPSIDSFRQTAVIGLVIAAILVVPTLGALPLLAGLILGTAALFGVTRLSSAQFGGQSGDVAGAAALVCEIAFLIGALIFARTI